LKSCKLIRLPLDLDAQTPDLTIALTPPELAEEIAAGIKGAKLEYIAGAAHLPTLEEPEATNEVMKAWLRS